MTTHGRNKIAMAATLALLISCSDMGRADQIVAAADKKAEQAGSLYFDTETRAKKIFDLTGQTAQEIKAKRAKSLDEARSIADDYKEVSDMLKDAAAQYEAVSQMFVNDEHKEFAKARSDEYSKRSQAISVVRDGVQAFIDTDDLTALHTKLAECLEKQHELFKEADDLKSKANMIRHKSDPLIKWN